MRGQQSARAWRDGGGGGRRVDEMIRPALNRHRDCAGEVDGGGSGGHRVRGEHDFVAGTHSHGAQRQVQCVGGVGDAGGIDFAKYARARECGQVALEAGQVLLQDERAAPPGIAEDADELFFFSQEVAAVVEERDCARLNHAPGGRHADFSLRVRTPRTRSAPHRLPAP